MVDLCWIGDSPGRTGGAEVTGDSAAGDLRYVIGETLVRQADWWKPELG